MISIATLVVASAVSVPPGDLTVNHGHKYQYTQPTQKYFTRRHEDQARGKAWMGYVDELDALWAEYRAAGSTPEAWEIYKTRAAAAKRCYVYQDPYYKAQVYYVRNVRPEDYRDCADGNCHEGHAHGHHHADGRHHAHEHHHGDGHVHGRHPDGKEHDEVGDTEHEYRHHGSFHDDHNRSRSSWSNNPTNHGHAQPAGPIPGKSESPKEDVLIEAPKDFQGEEPVIMPYEGGTERSAPLSQPPMPEDNLDGEKGPTEESANEAETPDELKEPAPGNEAPTPDEELSY